jgi:orotate phosphoribosyltransferase
VSALNTARQHAVSDFGARERLRDLIDEKSLLKDGTFTLASGKSSTFFFDMKKSMFDPEAANLIADAILCLPQVSRADAIGGLEMGAVPIIAVVCAKSFALGRPLPGFFVRKERKDHGTKRLIDGAFKPGARVVLVEDVTTSGGSVMQAVNAVRAQDCTVDTVVTVVDREAGARENLAAVGINLVPIFTRRDFE